MKKFKAAALQMSSQPDVEQNLKEAENLIQKAVDDGAELVGLPEHFAFYGDTKQRIDQARQIAEKSEKFLRIQARTHQIYLLGGSIPAPAGKNKVYNRSLLLNPDGKIAAKYDKVHLFDVDIPDGDTYRESNLVEAGKEEPPVYKSELLGNLGLSICYDLRFPELYRKLAERDAEILCVPSAFTALTGEVHWEVLLKARAIENTAFIFAPAQTGKHGDTRKTFGHAMIIDPWGEVIADAGTETGVAMAELDPARLIEVRQRIPSLNHRVFI